MESKTRIKEFALIYLIAIILLLGAVAVINLSKGISSITGFAVAGNESNESAIDETQLDGSIKVIDLSKRVDATDETTATNETSTTETAAQETPTTDETAATATEAANETAVNETADETEGKGKPEK